MAETTQRYLVADPSEGTQCQPDLVLVAFRLLAWFRKVPLDFSTLPVGLLSDLSKMTYIDSVNTPFPKKHSPTGFSIH